MRIIDKPRTDEDLRRMSQSWPSDECWEWPGAPTVDGMGTWRGKLVAREFWRVLRGEVPEGSILRKRCYGSICANPGHYECGPRAKTGRWTNEAKAARRERGKRWREPQMIRVEGDVAYIALPDGREALIDASDVPLVRPYRWYTLRRPDRHTDYVCRETKPLEREAGAPRRVMLHRHLNEPPPGLQTDHVNWNGLDNRRANFRHVTQSQNQSNRRPADLKRVTLTQQRRAEGKLPPVKKRGPRPKESTPAAKVELPVGPIRPAYGSMLIDKRKGKR